MGDGLRRARDAARATRGLPPAAPKLAEIAERIAAHLRRFEADPVANALGHYVAARIVRVSEQSILINYRGGDFVPSRKWRLLCSLKRSDAAGYLAWLDAGGVGRHWEWERQRASKGVSK